MSVDEITSSTHDSIDAAFVAALGELTNPIASETADMGQYEIKYADLPGVLDVVRPVFARHELAISQPVCNANDNALAIETLVRHSSGGVISSGLLVVRMPPNPQQTGSTITYLRRYQLCALLGIAADADDDGRAASTAPARKRTTATKRSAAQERVERDTTPPATTRPVAEITSAQRSTIMGLFSELGLRGDDMRDARLRYTSEAIGREIASTNEVTRDEAKTLITKLIEECKSIEAGELESEGYQ